MFGTFHISLSGLNVATRRTQVIAHNIANLLTPGFKSAEATVSSLKEGGATISSVRFNLAQGPLQINEGRFSLAIDGEGFFAVQTPAGIKFTRAGSFSIDASGNIITPEGYRLLPEITVPQEAVSVNVDHTGRVFITTADRQSSQIGQIQLYRFPNSAGLIFEGENLVSQSPASGEPIAGTPTESVFGRIIFGYLEGSNVELSSQMVSLLVNRAYFQANLSALRTQDRMIGSLLETIG